MNNEHENIKSTINYYNKNTNQLIEKYESADMSDLHKTILNHLEEGSKVLDIGFGSGRDLAFLKNKGFEVWGADPSQQFVDHAKQRFSDISNRFFNSSLPILNMPKKLQNSFDSIILVAVWMHLPKRTYNLSITSLCSFLKPYGKIILSYSVTPREEKSERHFENIDSSLLQTLFEENGCTQISKI